MIFKRATLKYPTRHNQPQPSTTTNNHPQPSTTTHNHPQPHKITQKSYSLLQTVMLLHLDVNTETEVDFGR